MKRSRLLALAVLAALVAIAWWTRSQPAANSDRTMAAPTPLSSARMDAGVLAPGPVGRSRKPGAITEQWPAFPASLQGVALDGGIRLDAAGQVVADRDLRRLFDFLLTSLGEQDLLMVRRQLQSVAVDTVGPAAQQVLDLFERYLHYLRAADGVMPAGSDAEALRRSLDQLAALRRQLLGAAMADGFFGDQEAYDRLVLERLQIEQDPMLSPAERGSRLEDWADALPPSVQAQRAAATAHLDVVAENRALDELAIDATERHRLRSEQYGPAAADRLAELDAARQAWEARADHYFEQLQHIDRMPDLVARDAALAALTQGYTDAELRRLAALQRIRAQTSH